MNGSANTFQEVPTDQKLPQGLFTPNLEDPSRRKLPYNVYLSDKLNVAFAK